MSDVPLLSTDFARESIRLNSALEGLSSHAQERLTESLINAAVAIFTDQRKSLGLPFLEGWSDILWNEITDESNNFDPRISECYLAAYVKCSSDGSFDEIEEQKNEQAAEELAKPKRLATVEERAPSRVKIEGNRTVISRNDETVTAGELSALTPDKLTPEIMKALKNKAIAGRRDHTDPRSLADIDRGVRKWDY
jgi:hypothetical protein